MRFMMLMIPNVYQKDTPADALPTAAQVAAMSKYNQSLVDAGMMLSGEGLHPLQKGARVSFSGGKSTIKDGPFAEAKEILGGYSIIQAASKDDAVAWAAKCPAEDGDIIEVRQIQEIEDFPEDVQEAVRVNSPSLV